MSKIDPAEFRVGPDAEVSDIDLDSEKIYFRGERLTEKRAEELSSIALAAFRSRNLVPGGKSLSRDGSHSPRVQFRVPEKMRATAQKRAEREGVSLSVLARRALEQYLAS